MVDYRFFTQLFWAGFNIFASVIIFISNGGIFFYKFNQNSNKFRKDFRNFIKQEIQRLIGRSLRQAVNLKYLKGKTINIDCDVIQADGGTRTAAITGGCVALFLAINKHHDDKRAIKSYVAAVSLGVKDNNVLLDLDYSEDSSADTDLNIVMNDKDELIEIQGTAEDAPFSKKELDDMLVMGSSAIADIIKKQKAKCVN